ncbi:MAG TPA: hypothetical protein VKY39_08790 [Aggregatilineales bacterium]|jgi:hypothetical protein|nr:hypothetical protein [Aggregatilineales bacterium]
MAEKKGARKSVGKARKGNTGPKYVMRLYYVEREDGSFAPKYERVLIGEEAAAN